MTSSFAQDRRTKMQKKAIKAARLAHREMFARGATKRFHSLMRAAHGMNERPML